MGRLVYNASPAVFFYGFKKGLSGIVKKHYKTPLLLLTTIKNCKIQLVCVSEWQKKLVVMNGFPKDNETIIRQAIDIGQLIKPCKSDMRETFSAKFRIGFLGRFVPEKGSSLLLDIIELLKKDNRFHFVLRIPPANSNQDEMKRLYDVVTTIPDNITILDSITSVNKAIFYQQIDCLLIQSFFWETGPIVLLEALAFQKQVIGADLAGIAEYKEEFPEAISTFQWGDARDAVKQLRKKLEGKRREGKDEHIMQRLIEKEKDFSEKQIYLYQQVLKKDDVTS